MSKLLVIRHGQARLFADNYDRLSELDVRHADDNDTRYRSMHQLLTIIMQRWIKGDYEHGDSLLIDNMPQTRASTMVAVAETSNRSSGAQSGGLAD